MPSPGSSPGSDSFVDDTKREYGQDFEDAIDDVLVEEEEGAGRVTGPPRRAHWKVCLADSISVYRLELCGSIASPIARGVYRLESSLCWFHLGLRLRLHLSSIFLLGVDAAILVEGKKVVCVLVAKDVSASVCVRR